jgi:hypothetical protein
MQVRVWRKCVFFESDEVCETSYKDRGGNIRQTGVTLLKHDVNYILNNHKVFWLLQYKPLYLKNKNIIFRHIFKRNYLRTIIHSSEK